MDTSNVVTCFIEHEGKVLLLKRSTQVGTYQHRWAGVSGYVEPGVTPPQQARQELEEELELKESDLSFVKAGQSLETIDEKLDKKWIVHPFRFYLNDIQKIHLDWENTEYRWVKPEEIKNYPTVPNLWDTWERVK